MKTLRIVSSVALAAAIAVGATGCNLIAPQGTTEVYAPSDGVDVNLSGVDVRNILLVEDDSGQNFNVVFTGVNSGEAPALLRITFTSGNAEASGDFQLEVGSTSFGNPSSEIAPTLVTLPGAQAGGTVEAYFEVAGGGTQKLEVPIVDGTLEEYRDYVLSPSQLRALEQEQLETGERSMPGEVAEVADTNVEVKIEGEDEAEASE